jgi:hypothetical protein
MISIILAADEIRTLRPKRKTKTVRKRERVRERERVNGVTER